MTYHKFRDAYFAACVRNAELEGSVKSVDYERYAFQILGDNDSETLGRYKRFDIKPGSMTKIKTEAIASAYESQINWNCLDGSYCSLFSR